MYLFYILGKVFALSLNTPINIEDSISITNNNLLQMSLIQSSLQNMCLPSKDSSNYIINIKK